LHSLQAHVFAADHWTPALEIETAPVETKLLLHKQIVHKILGLPNITFKEGNNVLICHQLLIHWSMFIDTRLTLDDAAHGQVLEHLLPLLLLTLRKCIQNINAHVVDVDKGVVEELNDLGAHGFHALLHLGVRLD